MSLVPDLVGYSCEESKKVMKQAGLQFTIHEAVAPKQDNKDGECRVIRQIQSDQQIEIVVSYF
ncbi:PASTA domain-containing protein [Geosporobacter subterraneus DSM 17957]|uniref:PASTA domain-containing protein n=1 Tax=Geosporobacter subterraneus DSM 17957 TaxID=1121919 RepID=A0A1M6E1H8_9FIRM|nr:PASTA domain-containing protein [Geosporobacter subterraneus]SHI79301.1 PASTA domain-containing protein [Geosporobacter subterraneus DSM 17957]